MGRLACGLLTFSLNQPIVLIHISCLGSGTHTVRAAAARNNWPTLVFLLCLLCMLVSLLLYKFISRIYGIICSFVLKSLPSCNWGGRGRGGSGIKNQCEHCVCRWRWVDKTFQI